ncbi:MAG: cobyric acid synthase [Victivallales bacterium]|nr:cobyric acid synthase [Victivallales bacterium]
MALAKKANCRAEEILDFSANLNLLGSPPEAFDCYFRSFDLLGAYPEPYAESVTECLAKKWGIPPERILLGNGSNILLNLLPGVSGAKRALIIVPGYLNYEASCRASGLEVERFTLVKENDFALDMQLFGAKIRQGDLVILGNPGNPIGGFVKKAKLTELVAKYSEALFLVDEAFVEFADPAESLVNADLPNLIVSRSFTKFYAMPGLRMGAVVGSEELIAKLRERLGEWALSTPAGEMMKFLLSLPEEGFASQTRRETMRLRRMLSAEIGKIAGFTVFPSEANYILIKSSRDDLANELLLKHKIAIRDCSMYPGLGKGFYRIAVRKEKEMEQLLDALQAPKPYCAKKRRTPALMLQGTCSNAGKSVLTSAFCRILLQDGFAVAPFKAQNMSLNSFVTPDGGEIGRAQALQAEACRIDPETRMNPILLKPNSDQGSQLILHGQAVGNYNVREYIGQKPKLWREVTQTYDSLSSDYEVMVLEGAGSPGEINLKSHDLVNMRMADYAQAKVLLTGDIDRGGVYAAFAGTWATLTPRERKLVDGFVVNKFRGDASLLDDANTWIERFTGRSVRGVIDYQFDIGLPEEDSVNFSFVRPVPKESKTLDIVLIELDHIANFTDFTPFEIEPDVVIRKVAAAADFGEPDAVLLPGSKGVAADLAGLHRRGLTEQIRLAAKRGALFAGICGGLQLLGERLLDPDSVESPEKCVHCLGFLPLETTMRPKKTLRQTQAFLPDGTMVSGYEIHHGETVSLDSELLEIRDKFDRAVGFIRGNYFATYLHGVFDNDRFRRSWIDQVRIAKGWKPKGGVSTQYGVENALNRLADHVRSRVDMTRLYRKIGLK